MFSREASAKFIFENASLANFDLPKRLTEAVNRKYISIEDLSTLKQLLQMVQEKEISDELDEIDLNDEIRQQLKGFFKYSLDKENTPLDAFLDEISIQSNFTSSKWLSNTLNNITSIQHRNQEEKKKNSSEFHTPIAREAFTIQEAYYTITQNTKYYGNPGQTFDEISRYIATSPAYKDPTSRILIDENNIYIGHSWKEMGASFPELAKKLLSKNHKELSEKHLSRDGCPAISDWNISFNLPIENRQNKIKQEAKIFYAKENVASPITPKLPNVSTDTLLEKLLQTEDIIALGEASHSDPTTKLWLANKMSSLKNAGVDTLYLEHLLHDTQLSLLKKYNESKDASMPIMLKDYLSNLDKQFQLDASNGFLNLVIQAKLNGIKVVPIDTEASYHTPDLYLSDYKKDASGRHAMMNYEATRIIRGYEQTKKGKSIIFCGSGHLNQVTQTPGLRQLIGCTTIVLQTYEANNQQEKVISTPEHETKPDFMMYVNPTKSFANTLETKTSIKKIPATISLLSELLQELTKNYSPKNSLSQKKLDLLQTCDTILSNAKDESIVKKILPYIIAIALQKTAFHFKDKTTLGHNLRELLKNNKFKSISDMLKLDAKKIESKPDSPNHVTYEELRLLGNIQNEKNIKHFFSSKPELHLNHIQKQLEKMQEEIIQQKLNLDSHP